MTIFSSLTYCFEDTCGVQTIDLDNWKFDCIWLNYLLKSEPKSLRKHNLTFLGDLVNFLRSFNSLGISNPLARMNEH